MKSNKIFIAGISYRDLEGNALIGKYGDEKLAAFFSKAGTIKPKTIKRKDGTEAEVVGANIATQVDERTGNKMSRGFGFVEFETEEMAENAINMFNGVEFEGRVITVRFSEPRAEGDRGGNAGGASSFRPRRQYDN